MPKIDRKSLPVILSISTSLALLVTLNVTIFAALLMPIGVCAQTGRHTLPKSATLPSPSPQPDLPPVPDVAGGYEAPHVAPKAAQIIGIVAQPFVGIGLQDAIGMALLKNPELAVAAANTRIAGYQIAVERGAFDVKFNVEPSVTHVTNAPTNAFFAGPNFGAVVQNIQTASAGISDTTPGGQQYSISLSTTKEDDNTIINSFNPYYPSVLSVQLTQPLLKDAGENEKRHKVELAVITAQGTADETLATISTTIAQVEDAYWDLVAAWRNVAIQEAALRAAVAQQGSEERLARQGAIANIDVVEVTTQVASFQSAVYSALQTVVQLQSGLKSMIVSDPTDPIWRANLVPTSPVLRLPPEPTLKQLITVALRQRPEAREIDDLQHQANENLKYAINQLKPQLDLKLGYTNNGFAGTPFESPILSEFGPLPPTPAYLIGSTGQSLSNVLNNRFPTYSAAIVFSTPIGEHTEKANLAIAIEQERNAGIERYGIGERVGVEAQNALQSYESALARLSSARTAREGSEQVYASELRKFRNGASTTYLVLQRQVQLAQNRGLELEAQTDLNKAVVEIQRVSGDILSANNVNLTTVGSGVTFPTVDITKILNSLK